MSMFRAAQRSKSKLRLSIIGPSGAGKTYSALKIAFGLGGKVVVIDSENGSADLYSGLGKYDVFTMQPPYEPEKLMTVIKAAEAEGYDTIIVDSLSHYWSGEGGLLDRHTKIGGNSYTAWAKVSPVQQRLIECMLSSKCHIIANMRAKQDYILVDKGGKQVPEKVGLAPVQRDQIEFEFSLVLTINMEHVATASKDRTELFDGKWFTPSEETGKQLLAWLENGTDAAPAPSPQFNPAQPGWATQQMNVQVPQQELPFEPAQQFAPAPEPPASQFGFPAFEQDIINIWAGAGWSLDTLPGWVTQRFGGRGPAMITHAECQQIITEITTHIKSMGGQA